MPYLLMILVVMIYAGNILIGKAINDLPPFTITFIRLFIAFVVLIPLGLRSALKHRQLFLENKKAFLIMTLAGVTFFNTFIYGSLQFTTATNVSVLETVIPVVTVILSTLLLKEKLQGLQWIGIVLSFFGAIWVILNGRIFDLASMAWNIGDLIMVGAILSWAIYSIYVKQYMHLFPSFAALFVMSGISVIVLLPVVLLEWSVQGMPTISLANHGLGLLYLGVFPSLIALILYNHSVSKLGPSKASVFLNFLPVFTILGAYLWLGETITLLQVIGAIIVISGVLLTTQLQKKKKEHNQTQPQEPQKIAE
ncbi:DMT family transporter [Aquibacillus koreensis]|uniref:DMT family transporter n=1 Tax=Aquibacillus koreensis TaxID=279446 RepID=A0A9X4AJJ5_9BACI|nr:DMT family transporter [Aquibacillus koreensis]MCT2536035.1 DMT family transporter [Aquibacillus koreensis]MDC3420490.1 DMT family transporter [Aquibacillus koreensis]